MYELAQTWTVFFCQPLVVVCMNWISSSYHLACKSTHFHLCSQIMCQESIRCSACWIDSLCRSYSHLMRVSKILKVIQHVKRERNCGCSATHIVALIKHWNSFLLGTAIVFFSMCALTNCDSAFLCLFRGKLLFIIPIFFQVALFYKEEICDSQIFWLISLDFFLSSQRKWKPLRFCLKIHPQNFLNLFKWCKFSISDSHKDMISSPELRIKVIFLVICCAARKNYFAHPD